VIDIVEILVHWHAGRKKADVARSLGVDRGTVAKYTAKAESEGYVPGGEQLSVERWAELAHGWFPKLVDPRQRSLTHATIDAHRSEIEQMLKTNTATTVHQRLRDEHGLKVGISSFRPRVTTREWATIAAAVIGGARGGIHSPDFCGKSIRTTFLSCYNGLHRISLN
jgi:hypothetical protein